MSRMLPVGKNEKFQARSEACDDLLRQASWYKSSWSAHNGNCVEIANLPGGEQGVRDSKSKDGSVLVFTASEWRIFLVNVKAGHLDLG
jgi:hypothetical protein